jgi:hypothetical protein
VVNVRFGDVHTLVAILEITQYVYLVFICLPTAQVKAATAQGNFRDRHSAVLMVYLSIVYIYSRQDAYLLSKSLQDNTKHNKQPYSFSSTPLDQTSDFINARQKRKLSSSILRLGLIVAAALVGTTAAASAPDTRTPPTAVVRSSPSGCATGDTFTTEGVQIILDGVGPIDWLDLSLTSI